MKCGITTTHVGAENQPRPRIDSSPDVFADADLAVVRWVGHELLQLLSTVEKKTAGKSRFAVDHVDRPTLRWVAFDRETTTFSSVVCWVRT